MRLAQRFESARQLSILPIDKRVSRKKVTPGRSQEATLHHPYITETWVKEIHKLLARNVCLDV